MDTVKKQGYCTLCRSRPIGSSQREMLKVGCRFFTKAQAAILIL
jgi:hypothetical protein